MYPASGIALNREKNKIYRKKIKITKNFHAKIKLLIIQINSSSNPFILIGIFHAGRRGLLSQEGSKSIFKGI